MLNINLVGAVNVSKAALRYQSRTAGPATVMLSSIEVSPVVAITDLAATFEYAASKAALESLTRSLTYHHAHAGIRVNAVAPGPIRTAMTASTHPSGGSLPVRFQDRLMLKRYGTARRLPPRLLSLLSDSASYITGSVIPVDGGFNAM
jgi:NAD(P)-dependent dehydrogenase (short-subunit alcohol dehydrogenase family)